MGSSVAPVVVWFRYDLRLDDQPALAAAMARGGPVLAVFVLDPQADGRPLGGASSWWLHRSLQALRSDLKLLGIPLIFCVGESATCLQSVAQAVQAQAIFWNQGHTPWMVALDHDVRAHVADMGIETQAFFQGLLAPSDQVRTREGKPFKVFTPFWKTLSSIHPPDFPCDIPEYPLTKWRAESLDALRNVSCDLEDLGLLPASGPDWAAGLREMWTPGEEGAKERLCTFLETVVESYEVDRDFPARVSTSLLSPHIRFGEVSVRRLWHATLAVVGDHGLKFLSEVGWRDFNHHILFQYPSLHRIPLRREFEAFPWKDDEEALQAWCQGQTGYPLVDAGMRELWRTGWMHNRVRMIVGSFLVKDLFLPWQYGEEWFWDTLVDACPANNPGNWQWVSGCGADAAPFFRIFNPVTQAERFDKDGVYVRKWIPELRHLKGKTIHVPVTHDLFARCTYPSPLVDHAQARKAALEAFQALK